MDLFSRRVVGWATGPTLERGLVIRALERGGIICSMSGKGDCFDNAAMESFFGTLKGELIHGRRPFASREEARSVVLEFIEAWYTPKRRHSSLGYLSPEQFERAAAAELA